MINFMRSGLEFNGDLQITTRHRGMLDNHQRLRMISDRRNHKLERKVSNKLEKLEAKLDLKLTSDLSQNPSDE